MSINYSTKTDLKERWGGILENPYVSKLHRHLLDGFKVKSLKKRLDCLHFKNILDVGCGFGEYATINRGIFFGLDNSFKRVKFAAKRYKKGYFFLANATSIPFKNNSFEAVLSANTIHHLSDEEFLEGMSEMKRVSSRYIIIDDCIRIQNQSFLSKFFYSLDRGTKIRTIEEIGRMINRVEGIKIIKKDCHITFPGLYCHAVFILELT